MSELNVKNMERERLEEFALNMVSDKRELEDKVRNREARENAAADTLRRELKAHERSQESLRDVNREVVRAGEALAVLHERLVDRSLNMGVAWGMCSGLLVAVIVLLVLAVR